MPIVMSRDEWARICKWAEQDREDSEAARRRDYIKYLNLASKEMTKSWPNSLENVNKRNEEMRRARIEMAEQANSKFYKKYVKRKKQEQERMMYSARDIVFKNKDAPKLLLSAVLDTVVQKERIEQVKFNKELRRLAAEQKKQNEEDIARKAREWHEMNRARKQKRFELDKQYQQELRDQAHEIAERNRIEYEEELNQQKLDNIRANEEIEALKEFDEEFKAAEKARILADMNQARRELEQRRAEQAAREAMDDKLLEVLMRSKARIERRRKETEQDVKNKKMKRLEAISDRLKTTTGAVEDKEQANLEKANREREAADNARRKANEEKLAKLRRERLDERQKYLKDEAQRLQDFNTMRQWEIMNRFKNAELFEDYQEQKVLEKERKIKEYREHILKLWKEREDREARERAETRYFYGELAERKLRDADNKVLTHAQELLKEAEQNDRPTYPIHKAIHKYCKLYNLYPARDLPKSMKEHFPRYAPWDGTQPDPGYCCETPPPRAPHPDTVHGDGDGDSDGDSNGQPTKKPSPKEAGPKEPVEQKQPPPKGSNGLQGQIPSISKSNGKTKEESVEDYKRVGKANGLQRRAEQGDSFLPPITVVPCKTETCRCEFK